MTEPRPFKDHFSTAAAGYAAHRPSYPAALIDYLADLAPATACALDCGCGTGQLSGPLAGRFARVLATDASAAQIANAEPHPGVDYRVALAEDSGLPPASVDLITVAQAAHWLDLERFYAEVRRVARPGAALALISYGVLQVEGPPTPLVEHFYYRVLGPWWPAERRHVEEGYRSLPFPFAERQAPALAIEVQWGLAELLGYLDTWSAVRELEKAQGRAPVERFAAELAAAWGDPAARRTVRWPLALRVGQVDAP
ncbi:Methyltransferase domain-containing protein [Azotobacter beijerinckii]|uniref:Methyltransferase domain-containing protein n=1 Tax=Azotobacter beijerinckii TaxID=170623 RepID=A0A1H9KQB3_9GAMM|nr:class I SAM-dependent methyltransferase [Azotobacter beijerinckii]SEI75392.1 Methyltransferase domain-containing protein [Azotobacter beijerinckii]SER01302.1 Methyltransferase domain-containing protein [Azotobacter beijerinckii]